MTTTDDDLVRWLEASLGGEIASKRTLPTEAQLHAVHAQLERVIRENKVYTITEKKKHDDRAGDDAR